MVTEDYVSFETAKLLKEKGAYFDTDRVYTSIGRAWEINMKQFKKQFDYEVSNYIQRPTLQMALKWLREVHKIFVEPIVAIDLNGKYHYCFRLLNSICKDILEPKDLVRIDFKDTYEEAVEAGIKYCLENLIS